jgi:glycerophosphoryl diester phosphodiesterase
LRASFRLPQSPSTAAGRRPRQGNQLDGGVQPSRSRRLAATDDQGCTGAIWSPYFGDTEALISEVHGLGLRVAVWTVNKPEDMTRMIALGVDGIISDRPDLLRQVAGERGIALPAATPVAP